MKKFRLVSCAIAGLFIMGMISPAMAQEEKKISFSFGGSLGYATFGMEDVNELVREFNDVLDEVEEEFEPYEEYFGVETHKMSEIKGGLDLSGEARYALNPNVILAAGIGYLSSGKSSGSFDLMILVLKESLRSFMGKVMRA